MKTMTALSAALLVVLIASPMEAQVKVGLAAGLNRSTYHAPNDEAEHSSETGVHLGGVLDISLTEILGLRMEPSYIQKKASASSAAAAEEVTLKASAIEVPVFLRVRVGDATSASFLAGPTIAYMVSSDLTGSDTGIPFVADLMDVTKRVEVGVGIGGALSHAFGRFDGFAEGRYVWGLTNLARSGTVVLTSPGTDVTVDLDFDEDEQHYEFRGLQLLLGFTVPLGGG